MRNTAETINYYDEFTVQEMITDVVKHDRMKRKNKAKRKAQERKQKLCFRLLALALIIGGLAILFISPIDGSAAVACIGIGIMSLLVTFNMEITW